jgi:hypothetical protein
MKKYNQYSRITRREQQALNGGAALGKTYCYDGWVVVAINNRRCDPSFCCTAAPEATAYSCGGDYLMPLPVC